MSASKRLSDGQWQVIEPLLPTPSHMGRPRADDRRTLDAILFVLRSGCRWADLPQELGSAPWVQPHGFSDNGVATP